MKDLDRDRPLSLLVDALVHGGGRPGAEELAQLVAAGEHKADVVLVGPLVHSTSKVDYAVGSLTLAWFRREDPLPEQTGRLYQLRHDEGAQGFAVMIDALLESGALKFIGGWLSWDVVGDEPTYAHFRVGLRGPSALLPPGLESIL